MSKYIKVEDMENLIINIAPDGDVFEREILALQRLPTIEIVRCKDCKHFYADAECGQACELTEMRVEAEDYCSYGEREESEDE